MNFIHGRQLQIIPLGGLGEFGMNCTAARYGDNSIENTPDLVEFPGVRRRP